MQKSLRKPGVRPKTGELVDVDSQTEMDGYTRLAALIGNQPEYAIFRKYMTLRSLQLLHLNANIAHLEDELGEALKLDRACANPQNLYETSYRQLELSQKTSEPSKQLGVWQKLNIALKAQGDALLQYRSLLHLPAANNSDVDNLRAWLGAEEGGHHFLHGAEAFVWDKGVENDLTSLALRDGDEKDIITMFIHSKLLRWYHQVFGHLYKRPLDIVDPFTGVKQQMPIFYYSDRVISYVVNSMSTIMASMIPAVCTLALYFIGSPLARLGAITGFTFLFSTVLTLITNVDRAQCFGITAAFSAVLVVFVGNNDAAGCKC